MSDKNNGSPFIEKGMAIYCDAGCRPTNPGNGGWGFHGYLYENQPPKKGSGNQTHILTTSGYIPKSDDARQGFIEVKPLFYFDCFGACALEISNNAAEIEAMANTLGKALEYDIQKLTIFTDSQYVRRGIEEWSPVWVQRNWIRSDGQPVPNAFYWKQLLFNLEQLKIKQVTVDVHWVKGHTDKLKDYVEILGNIKADKLATIGVMNAMNKNYITDFKVSPAEGYWKNDIERHPFISNRRMYFNTLTTSQIPGEYYLGEHGTDDDMIGKRMGDGAYSIAQLQIPDPILEKVRNYQSEIACDFDSIVVARLDKLYSADVHNEITAYGKAAMVRSNNYSMNINCLDGKPLTSERRPARLAMRAIESITQLKEILNQFKFQQIAENSADPKNTVLTIEDITSVFYDQESKVVKKVAQKCYKLKPEFKVGFVSLPLMVKVKTRENNIVDVKVILTLGTDLPERNALKRLEEFNPEIYLVSWKDGINGIRYAVVAKAQGNYGIWAGTYTNLVFYKDTP